MANPIESLPRVALAALPTPLQPLKRLSAALGGPEIWVKRDDLTGAGGGGNKVRKLEFLLADALAQKADVVVTGGAIQSNHVRQTAALCGALGLACEGVLNEREFHNYFGVLMIAGNETTRHTISHGMLALMEHPEQLQLLRERPELIANATEASRPVLRKSSTVATPLSTYEKST